MNISKDFSVVVDNNILIDLFELNRLDILFDIFETVVIPRIIYEDEIMDNVKSRLDDHNFILADIETETGMMLYGQLSQNIKYKNLSKQDKFAISLSKEYEYYCNSNDGLVRKACDEYNVNYLGILGIFEVAFSKKIIDFEEITELCDELLGDDTSCYISKKIVAKFLLAFNEVKDV